MIGRITNPPAFMANLYSKNDYFKPEKQATINFNYGLKTDTVSFTSSSKQVEDVIKLAFDKLNKVRKNGQLATYFGTTQNNVNVTLRETDYGKAAVLTLTNGKFGNKTFANFELKRSSIESSKILSDNKNTPKAATMIKAHLENLR